jgi:lysine 2,3-aminomutase
MNRIDPKLAATLRQPAELVERGLAKAADLADLERVAARYAIAVTPDIAGLIDTENPDDPIARQFIPSALELVSEPAKTPIRSATTRIRRSPASSTAIPTACCSSWCMSARCIAGSAFAARWSGRARRPRCRRPPIATRWTISRHTEIWEVILTGGDPLMLSPRRLAEIMADLAAIDHVKIVRIHTRVPGGGAGAHRWRDGQGVAR